MNSTDLDITWATLWARAIGLPTGTPQWIVAGLGLIFILCFDYFSERSRDLLFGSQDRG